MKRKTEWHKDPGGSGPKRAERMKCYGNTSKMSTSWGQGGGCTVRMDG